MKNLARIFLGITLGFIVVEVALRLLGFPTVNTNTFDKNGLVIFKPNQSFLVKDRCYASIVTANDQGFHSATYSLDKPAGVYRIAVLGDSFVEAVQVPLEKTFTSLLEAKLNAGNSGLTYEVIPIGKSGNGAIKNMMYAREYALQYHPDLIIDAFITNDLSDDAKTEQIAPPTASPMILSIKHSLLERSLELERWWMNALVAKSQWGKKALETPGKADSGPRIDAFVEAQMEPQGQAAKDLWDGEDRALRGLSGFVHENGAKFMLVHLAEGYLIDPEELVSRYHLSSEQAAQFKPDLARQNLAAIASRAGFPFFSTEPAFLENFKSTGKLPILSCDNHYNELGHEWAAEAIYQFLRTRL